MGRRYRRGPRWFARPRKPRFSVCRSQISSPSLPRLETANRKSLLLGTALASTLLLGTLAAPVPAHALSDCLPTNPPPGPILYTNVPDDIVCFNTSDRDSNTGAIEVTAINGPHFVDLYNSGILTVIGNTGNTGGVFVGAAGNDGNRVDFLNTGYIQVISTGGISYAHGVQAYTSGPDSFLFIENYAISL